MNIWKKIFGIGLAVGLSVGMSISPVYADTISILDEITDEETTEDYAEDTSTILARSSNLSFGNVKIQRVASNEIVIYGLTACHKKCSKVYLSLYLERKVNGSYGTYKYWNFTANNTDELEKNDRRSSSIRYILPCAWIPCSQSVRYKRIYLYADAGYHGQIMTIGKGKRKKRRKILISNP